MQVSLNVRRINLLSALLITLALALGVGLGAGAALVLGLHPQVAATNPSTSVEHSPLPAECKRFGGSGC